MPRFLFEAMSETEDKTGATSSGIWTILELIKIASYAAVFYLCRMIFPLQNTRSLLLFTIFSSSVIQMFVAWYLYLSHHTTVLRADFVNPNNFACFLVFGVNIGLSFILFGDITIFTSNHNLYSINLMG